VRNHNEKLSEASSFIEHRENEEEERYHGCLTQCQWQEWDWVQILGCFVDIIALDAHPTSRGANMRAVDGGTIWDHSFMNVSTHSGITTPLINLPQWCLIVDEIDTLLRTVVLLERTSAVEIMLLADVYRCSKVYKIVDVRAVVSKRSKFLRQLGLEERFDVVPRPLEAPEGDVILCD